MYIPYLEKYIDNIIDIKKCAEKVAELNGFKSLDELDAFLFSNNKHSRQKRSIRRKIYRPLRNTIPKSQFLSILKESIRQDNYQFGPVTDEEMKSLAEWVELNGKKWRVAENVFHRPPSMLRRIYKRYLSGTGKRNILSLDGACGYILLILKYHPQTVFDVKDTVVHAQCTVANRLRKKMARFNPQAFNKYREVFSVYGHRFWSVSEYEFLFDYALQHSRPVLLDNIPCVLSIRYLALPVNQLFHPIEYIFRLVYLYIYYINEIPYNCTLRTFIEFLRERLVVQKEVIPTLCFRLKGKQFCDIEFCGFVRGCSKSAVKITDEMNEEVKWLNELELPSDDELLSMIQSANTGGCQLRLAAEYSRLIPSDMEQSEEMLYEEEWEQRRSEKMKNTTNDVRYLDEDSTDEEIEEKKKREKHVRHKHKKERREKKEKRNHKSHVQ